MSAKPSPTELCLLKALWKQEPLSAREIHELVVDELDWSYSSTRKTLERMMQKQWIVAEDAHGIRIYRPALKKVSTLASFVRDFARRVLELDGPLPVSTFVDSKLLNEDEVKELEALLQSSSEKSDTQE
ncbi:BlaI/MecI/CopY family transcriptional regulator [Pleionea sp. CnH1-48]|uniref:BlaI/MecI/CopY family transcriptional regulator n=1 Tax=Pleionea sp. CnH1-48 TaxID=2954494 RepID=UPI002097CD3E|nr:BlaI/MecI/CopY family transcriptional regulator [Pleionea sp. CnH1-48]MCO7225117.1 BlaI/MecI/CopY family transcriptional regulator [Pleionea sp. CnH1-48]